ncbi:peptidase M20, partial [Kitasatospora sp. NPDC007106]
MSEDRLLHADHALLLDLLELPTAGPLETGPGAPPPRLAEAQLHYACAAARIGLETVHHGPAAAADLDRPDVPPING